MSSSSPYRESMFYLQQGQERCLFAGRSVIGVRRQQLRGARRTGQTVAVALAGDSELGASVGSPHWGASSSRGLHRRGTDALFY
jgi:hypothetical protein